MLEKITPEELAGVGVIGLPDTPRLSTEEMQRKFEETAREVIIPKFNALVDELSAEDAAGKVGAVSTNAQALTEEQKAAARENIAALTWEADALDDAKKQQARANIGAIGAQEIGEMGGTVSYAAQQNLSEGQQTQARENIGAAAASTLGGCWIEFTDEDGNPTDEPYLHWEEGGDGKKPDTTFSELLAAVGNAVSVVAQGFTEAQKAQARANIGAAAVGEGGGAVGNAVLYDKQTLTDAQKAQARENINAGKPEKWVELADITTTEAVQVFFANTDKDGNPFSCRKLLVDIAWGGTRNNAATWWSWNRGGYSFGDNIDKTYTRFTVCLEVLEGAGVMSSHSVYNTGAPFWQDQHCGSMYALPAVDSLQGFNIFCGDISNAEHVIPVNTRFRLWGVKV